MIYKSLHNKLRIMQHEPLLKYGDKIVWDERVSKYVPTNDTVVVTLLKIKSSKYHSENSLTSQINPCTSNTTCSCPLTL